MKIKAFLRSVDNPDPVYVLSGSDPYLRDTVFECCRDQVGEAARTFDWSVHNLAETAAQEVIGKARTLPWMSPRRWVYVRNAQLGHSAFLEYLAAPSDRTVLVLEVSGKVKKWAGATRIDSELGVRPVDWVLDRVSHEGYTMDRASAQLFVDLVGDDLQRLQFELDKLYLWSPADKEIGSEAVLGLTLEARERDVFELINALAGRKTRESLRVLNRLFASGTSAHQIIPLLYWSFKRLLVAKERLEQGESFYQLIKTLRIWSFKGKEREVRRYPKSFIVELLWGLRETDRLIKTSGADPKIHLERVVVDTCRQRSV